MKGEKENYERRKKQEIKTEPSKANDERAFTQEKTRSKRKTESRKTKTTVKK